MGAWDVLRDGSWRKCVKARGRRLSEKLSVGLGRAAVSLSQAFEKPAFATNRG